VSFLLNRRNINTDLQWKNDDFCYYIVRYYLSLEFFRSSIKYFVDRGVSIERSKLLIEIEYCIFRSKMETILLYVLCVRVYWSRADSNTYTYKRVLISLPRRHFLSAQGVSLRINVRVRSVLRKIISACIILNLIYTCNIFMIFRYKYLFKKFCLKKPFLIKHLILQNMFLIFFFISNFYFGNNVHPLRNLLSIVSVLRIYL